MYSVLIQNLYTSRIFDEYRLLFTKAFKTGQIGECRWIESGKTVSTALPGLVELIEDKKEWRAIILRVEDGSEMRSFPSKLDNPYDFLINCNLSEEEETDIRESTVPLIRLTQMLGGVPEPEILYEEQLDSSDGIRATKVDFVPKAEIDEYEHRRYLENRKRYDELSRKYSYDGPLPSEIIIITLCCREKEEHLEQIRKKERTQWDHYTEMDSSGFWRRNHYPVSCRFLMYELLREGRIRKEADLFNYWSCVMLLVMNRIDPDSLQAYRLYNVHAEINLLQMKEVLQDKSDELRGCGYFVETESRRNLEEMTNKKNPKPVYEKNITISVDIPKDVSVTVNPREFGLVPDDLEKDSRKWDGLCNTARDNLRDLYRDSGRCLEEGVSYMRQVSAMREEEVTPLNKHETQRMREDLSYTFLKIIQMQNDLSDSRAGRDIKITKSADLVRKNILRRIKQKHALYIALVNLLLSVTACIPALVFWYKFDVGSIIGSVLVLLITIAVLSITEILVLYIHRYRLYKKIEQYNQEMLDCLAVLSNDASAFSRFVSNIVTYSRGSSFLNILKNKKFENESDYEALQIHERYIREMFARIKKWAKAFYLPVKYDRELAGAYDLNIDIPPQENNLYSIEDSDLVEIPLNSSGEMILSPYRFISALNIVREELFEDARTDD